MQLLLLLLLRKFLFRQFFGDCYLHWHNYTVRTVIVRIYAFYSVINITRHLLSNAPEGT